MNAPSVLLASPELDELQRKVAKAKSLLILDHPFFGNAVARRTIIYSTDVPTACMAANGQMTLNPDWCAPKTVLELMFLLAHEAMHFMLGHSPRLGTRDGKAWNIATDKVINDTLIDAKVGTFIEGGVTFDGARNHAAEELYDPADSEGDGPGGIGCDIGASFFFGLARRPFSHRFALFHKTGGQGPKPFARLDGAFAHEDFVFAIFMPNGNNPGHQFRIDVINQPACIADIALKTVIMRHDFGKIHFLFIGT